MPTCLFKDIDVDGSGPTLKPAGCASLSRWSCSNWSSEQQKGKKRVFAALWQFKYSLIRELYGLWVSILSWPSFISINFPSLSVVCIFCSAPLFPALCLQFLFLLSHLSHLMFLSLLQLNPWTPLFALKEGRHSGSMFKWREKSLISIAALTRCLHYPWGGCHIEGLGFFCCGFVQQLYSENHPKLSRQWQRCMGMVGKTSPGAVAVGAWTLSGSPVNSHSCPDTIDVGHQHLWGSCA